MATKPPDPRHRAVQLIEQGLTDAGCTTSPHLARWIVARLEASGLVIRDAPRPVEDPGADWRRRTGATGPTPEYAAARQALKEQT